MTQSHTLSGQSLAKLTSSSTYYRENLLELLHQAETYMQSGNYAATLEVLYLAWNLAPIFSTEFKAIRRLIHCLTCPPSLHPSESNSNDSNSGKFVANLLVILGILVELLKVVLGGLAVAGVLSVIEWAANANSLTKKDRKEKDEEKITCKDSSESQTSKR